MERRDNYAITAARVRQLFAEYDQQALARKVGAKLDGEYFYVDFLSERYRIHRLTGDISRFHGDAWVEANSFGEVLTLMDLICDSREDRHPTGNWRNMRDFGHGFHQQLLEQRDPWAERFQEQPEMFAKACEALGGEKYPLGDVAYAIPVFGDLRVLIQLWFGDEEFPAKLRYLWDENALQYLKYETMFYAVPLVLKRIQEQME
ncbi:MAG: DUF3786 domain-containing protein [Clostridiales bacterium]|nr:DUF3786 domain-containing protein [Clostridiales bacterium]